LFGYCLPYNETNAEVSLSMWVRLLADWVCLTKYPFSLLLGFVVHNTFALSTLFVIHCRGCTVQARQRWHPTQTLSASKCEDTTSEFAYLNRLASFPS
jgi:hypothetical protein